MNDVEDWHHTDIIAALYERGTSLAKVSRAASLEPQTLRDTFNRNWPRGEQLIAAALNLPPSDIWPIRYRHRASLLSEK